MDTIFPFTDNLLSDLLIAISERKGNSRFTSANEKALFPLARRPMIHSLSFIFSCSLIKLIFRQKYHFSVLSSKIQSKNDEKLVFVRQRPSYKVYQSFKFGFFSHRLTLKFHPMRLMNYSIENCISHCLIADDVIPFGNR